MEPVQGLPPQSESQPQGLRGRGKPSVQRRLDHPTSPCSSSPQELRGQAESGDTGIHPQDPSGDPTAVTLIREGLLARPLQMPSLSSKGTRGGWSCLRAGAWLKCPPSSPGPPRPARSAAHTEEQREVGRRLQGLEPHNLGPGGRLGPGTAPARLGAATEGRCPKLLQHFQNTKSENSPIFRTDTSPERTSGRQVNPGKAGRIMGRRGHSNKSL